MSIEALIVSLIMMVVSIIVLALPLLRRSRLEQQQRAREGERLKLLAAYERALMTVRDLDEDYQVGKLQEDQYQAERAVWLERGAAVLELLEHGEDLKHKPRKRDVAVKGQSAAADDPIETAIAAYIKAREQAQQPHLENAK